MNFSSCQRVAWLLLRGMKLAAHQSVLLPTIKCRSSTRRLAPRARFTSHPARWNAVDRHQSFQQDWCTFVLIIEGWGSLFLPEWIHVWLENATFFRNCFIRGLRRLQRATWQSSALLDCVLSGNEDSLTQSEEKRDLEGVFQTCEMDTVNFTALTGNTDIFPRRL